MQHEQKTITENLLDHADKLESVHGILRGCRVILDRPFGAYDEFLSAVQVARGWCDDIETATFCHIDCVVHSRAIGVIYGRSTKYILAVVNFSFTPTLFDPEENQLTRPDPFQQATSYLRVAERNFPFLRQGFLWPQVPQG